LAFLALGALIMLFVGAKYRFAFINELATGVLVIFAFFAAWGLASTLWSVSPAATLIKSAEYCAMLILFALAASLITTIFTTPRDQLLALKSVFDWNWFLILLLLINVYVGLLVFPEYGLLRDYRDEVGVLGFSIKSAMPGISANSVGQLAAVLGTVAVARLLLRPSSRIVFAPVLVLCLATLVLTQSRSPVLGFLVGIAVVLVASRRFGILAFLGTLLSSVMLAASAYNETIYETIYEYMRRGQNEQDVASLTGRLDLWLPSLQAVRDSWLGGYGANAGGRYIIQTDVGRMESASTVHSTYIETLLDTGVVGLVILLVGLGAVLFFLLNVRPHVTGSPIGRLLWLESLGVFAVLSVRSVFAVTSFVWSFQVLTFGLVLIFITVARRQIVQRRYYASASFAQQVPAARWRRPSLRR
jgi:O-antigen ligase